MLRWLTSVEYHSQQHQFRETRMSGTGQWLLNSAKFQAWRSATRRTLFCYGIPGAGKTILTSIVVDDLYKSHSTKQTTPVAYIYCNFRQQGQHGSQKVDDLLISLLKQLAQGLPSLPAPIITLYQAHHTKLTRPSREELLKALRSVVTLFSNTFVVLDALDELSDDCRAQFLPELFKMQAATNMNIFVTSRPTLNVEKEFQECISCDSLEISATDEDVQTYLEGRICELKVSDPESLREEITDVISKAAKGMYVLPSFPRSLDESD